MQRQKSGDSVCDLWAKLWPIIHDHTVTPRSKGDFDPGTCRCYEILAGRCYGMAAFPESRCIRKKAHSWNSVRILGLSDDAG